jgi:hypothetical protein
LAAEANNSSRRGDIWQGRLGADALRRLSCRNWLRSKNERDKAEQEFWALYWGPLSIVEDKNVEASMVRLGRCIQGSTCEKSIEQLALDLDYACRLSVSESWDVFLPPDVITFGRLERLRAHPMQDQKQ